MDHIIFFDKPQLTPELKYFIENRNRSFCKILFMKATLLSTLQYWFDNDRAKLTQDALALAIHLKSYKVVFEYLKNNTDLFNIPQQDKMLLIQLANAKLKDQRDESYTFLLEHLDRNYNKPNIALC